MSTVSESRVEFAVYYETLCPDCQNLMRAQLGPAYQAVGSIMDLQLVPYGNARVGSFLLNLYLFHSYVNEN